MSDVQNTTAPAVEPAVAEPVTAPVATETPAVASEPVVESTETPVAAETTEAAPAATEAAPAAEETVETEKAIEPISAGQLAYKGPGLVKSLIPSKKEFLIGEAAVEPANLSAYLRGEKAEISHPVVAYASQTGKGLLFFNKKGETDFTRPADVLALYDAVDLKKEAQNQFSFKIHAHTHTFKAATDAERDGWYLSIEKAIELGKATKEEVQSSEGYKAELEKLSKPGVPAVAAGAVKSKKTETEPEAEKKQKSRSTSRGLLNRLKGNKEETPAEEKKAEETAPEDAVAEPESAPVGEVAPVAAAVPADVAAEETPAEVATETPAVETKAEEKPKPNKRASIFGKFSLKSPAKEKDQKEAELGSAPVSENPPVLPETATTEPAAETTAPVVAEPAVETAVEAPKESEAVSPAKEKTNFLSSFIKRSRSVSPSTALKEEPKKEETVAAPAAEEPAVAETAATEEPAVETTAETTEEARPEPTKRQSVLGSIGRRASKAFGRKEKVATPAAETTEETTEEAAPAAATEATTEAAPAAETEAPVAIADVVPEAVSVGQPQSTPVVTASA